MLPSKELQCHWSDIKEKRLNSITFDLSTLRVEDIVQEFGGERKGTKLDTIIDGLTKSANKLLATQLLGRRVMISNSPKALYLTELDPNMLNVVPLPPEISALLQPAAAPANGPTTSFAAAFSSSVKLAPSAPTISATEEKQLCYATKELFRQLAGYLKHLYADQRSDIFIFEVVGDLRPQDVASSVLNNGDPLPQQNKTGKEREMTLTFGFQKKISNS